MNALVAWYRSMGWAPVRIPPLSKGPVSTSWPTIDYGPDDFAQGDNIGIKLGDPSGGLVDIDLDCPEAIALAGRYLPPTCTFGRVGAGKTPGVVLGWDAVGRERHWLYISPGLRTKKPPHVHVEMRSTGLQSVFPGSIHETGVPIDWCTWVDSGPAAVGADALGAAFGRLCAAVVVARWWGSDAARGQRHDAALAFAGALWHAGWQLEDALDLLLPPMELDGSREPHREKAIRDTWDDDGGRGRWGWPAVQRLLGGVEAGALERAVALVPVARPALVSDADERPEIDLAADQADVLRAIGDALCGRAGTHGLYRQGDALVTVDGPATAHRVAVELGRAVRFVRQTKQARVPAHVPVELASKVAADPPALPELVGRRATPLLRPDGSVWGEPGYDAVCKMWCDGWGDPGARALDREGAAAACARLLGFVWADQWESGDDAFAWLAHTLTVAARPAVGGPVPVWVYSAPAPGSGKTALACVAGVIGGRCGDITSGAVRDDQELALRLDAHAMRPAVVLDNMRGALRSETLEGAVTGGVLTVRRLYIGNARAPWRCVLSVTSNGASIGHDWARRVLPVRLSSRKLPAARDIIEEARGRDDLTADAVGIVAGYLRSGVVSDVTPLLGFVEWARIVAGAIRWAMGVDVVAATRDASADMVASEDDGGPLLDLLAGWLAASKRTEFEAREIFEASGPAALALADLRSEYPDANTLGRRLARCSDSSRALRSRKSHGKRLWRIENR